VKKSNRKHEMLCGIQGIASLFLLFVSTGSAFLLPHSAFRPARTCLGSCQYPSLALTRSITYSRVQTGRSKIYAHAALDESSTAHDVIERFGADLKGKTALVTG
jgi:hypothetical protein